MNLQEKQNIDQIQNFLGFIKHDVNFIEYDKLMFE